MTDTPADITRPGLGKEEAECAPCVLQQRLVWFLCGTSDSTSTGVLCVRVIVMLWNATLQAVPVEAACYYHSMIAELRSWGYKDRRDLFGFGYDFRQSNRCVHQHVPVSSCPGKLGTIAGTVCSEMGAGIPVVGPDGPTTMACSQAHSVSCVIKSGTHRGTCGELLLRRRGSVPM